MTILKGANAGGWFLPVYLEDEVPDAPSESTKLSLFAQLDSTGSPALFAINSDGEVMQLSTNNNLLQVVADGSKLTQELLEELRIIRAALVSLATDSNRTNERDLLAEANTARVPVSH